jgi:hypothetical protein
MIYHLFQPQSGSWLIPWNSKVHPHQEVQAKLAPLGIQAKVIHSTSWRYVNDQLIITYLVVIKPIKIDTIGFQSREFARVEVIQGEAQLPPKEIKVDAVISHALRHLSWLYAVDENVHSSLQLEWRAALRFYDPEPFRFLESKSMKSRLD